MLKNFDEVLEKVRSIEPFTVSVAAAEDRELLLAVKAAADLGFVRPVLAGDPKAVGDICAEIGLKPWTSWRPMGRRRPWPWPLRRCGRAAPRC